MSHWTTMEIRDAFRRLGLQYADWDYENFLVYGGLRDSCIIMQDENKRVLTAVLLTPMLVRQQLDPEDFPTMQISYRDGIKAEEIADLLLRAGFPDDWLPPKRPMLRH